jgi:hypothetical protein
MGTAGWGTHEVGNHEGAKTVSDKVTGFNVMPPHHRHNTSPNVVNPPCLCTDAKGHVPHLQGKPTLTMRSSEAETWLTCDMPRNGRK